MKCKWWCVEVLGSGFMESPEARRLWMRKCIFGAIVRNVTWVASWGRAKFFFPEALNLKDTALCLAYLDIAHKTLPPLPPSNHLNFDAHRLFSVPRFCLSAKPYRLKWRTSPTLQAHRRGMPCRHSNSSVKAQQICRKNCKQPPEEYIYAVCSC